MSKRSDTQIHLAAKTGFENINQGLEPDYFTSTKTEIHFSRAYYDKEDGLPVVVCKLDLDKSTRNFRGELDTGALCVIMDLVSTFAALYNPNWWFFSETDPTEISFDNDIIPRLYNEFGVSRTIKVHRVRPIRPGTTIYISIKILENTPATTYFGCKFYDFDGHLLASGTHDKTKLTKVLKPKL